MSTEFLHVSEFLETIFCFSILILIAQRFVMMWKKYDQIYLQQRIDELEQQILWERMRRQGSPIPSQQNQSQKKKQQQQVQPPKQEHLRTSLVENQHNQTGRQISQRSQDVQQKPYKRKSLTDLMKLQEANSKQIQIKNDSQAASQRKKSIDIKEEEIGQRKITYESDNSRFKDMNSQQPSVASNNQNALQSMRQKNRVDLKITIFRMIDTVFDEHLSVFISLLVLGILVHSTYIFAIVSLFGFIFTHLLIKFKNSMGQLRNDLPSQSFISKLIHLLPKLWIIGLFISYWSDSQYS